MPGGDRTGPRGYGEMTGRRAGYCAGYDRPGYENSFRRSRRGTTGGFSRSGGGHGWRHWFHATGLPRWARAGAVPSGPEQELPGLKNEAQYLKRQLDSIHRRIEELEK
jgi:hypothetical protein